MVSPRQRRHPQLSTLIRLLKRAKTKAAVQEDVAALHAGGRVGVITADAAAPMALRL